MHEQATALAPVRATIHVRRSPEDAFGFFTERMQEWWPLATHSVGETRAETVVLEAGAGGRWLERIQGGEECVWGEVLVWDPPRRFVSTWHPGRAAESAQELEVTFEPEGDGTRVTAEFRGWERLGERAARARVSYVSGSEHMLARYAERANDVRA